MAIPTAAERDLWLTDAGVRFFRVEVKRPDEVAWTNLSATMGGDWVLGVRHNGDRPDQPAGRFDLRFLKHGETESLSPGITASALNRDAALAYRPLIHPGRDVRVWAAVTSGAAPATADWRLWLVGQMEDVAWGGDVVEAACFTRDGQLNTAWITEEEERNVTRVGDVVINTSSPIDVEIQELLDRWHPNPPTLVVQGAPTFKVGSYTPAIGSLGEQIRTLAQRRGWDVRYLPHAAWDDHVLTLYEPPRGKTLPDYTLAASEVYAVEGLRQSRQYVRNDFRITYLRADTDEIAHEHITDEGSRKEYGTQSMVLVEDEASVIDSPGDAIALLNLAKSDLSQPLADGRYRIPFFPLLRLHDLLEIAADGDTSDTPTQYAVTGIDHEVDPISGASTIVEVRGGGPVGQYLAWLKRDAARWTPDGAEWEVYNLRLDPALETATELGLRFDAGSLVEEVWGAADVFEGADVTEAMIFAVRRAVELVLTSDAEGAYLMIPKADQGWNTVAWLQPFVFGRTDLGGRHFVVEGGWDTAPPVIELDDAETTTVGTQWWRLQERGVAVTGVQVLTQVGSEPPSGWTAPARSAGGASIVRGGTLGAGEYEHDVHLDSDRLSWIMVDVTLEDGERLTLGPFAYDRNREPEILFIDVDGQNIKCSGDSDVESWRAERVNVPSGGDTYVEDRDGANTTFTSVPVPAAEVWEVEITAYSDPTAGRDASTLSVSETRLVRGDGASTTEPTWHSVGVTAPAVSSDVMTITVRANEQDTAGGEPPLADYETHVWAKNRKNGGTWSSWADITADLVPIPGAPVDTIGGEMFDYDTNETHDSSGTVLYEVEIRAELVRSVDSVVVDARAATGSWYLASGSRPPPEPTT